MTDTEVIPKRRWIVRSCPDAEGDTCPCDPRMFGPKGDDPSFAKSTDFLRWIFCAFFEHFMISEVKRMDAGGSRHTKQKERTDEKEYPPPQTFFSEPMSGIGSF